MTCNIPMKIYIFCFTARWKVSLTIFVSDCQNKAPGSDWFSRGKFTLFRGAVKSILENLAIQSCAFELHKDMMVQGWVYLSL